MPSVVRSTTAQGASPSSADGIFKPYRANALRLPAVPLILNDPYFSVWSPYDHLTDGATRHWTGADKPLLGLLRVDGKTYRFMGSDDRDVLEPILPMADEIRWQALATQTKPDARWMMPDYDPAGWHTVTGAIGSDARRPVGTMWSQENSDYYVRRSFTLDEKDLQNNAFVLKFSHDDVFELYLNGHKLVDTGMTWRWGETLHLNDEQRSWLKAGDNLIAAHCHNTTGGAYLDFGFYRSLSSNAAGIDTARQLSVSVMPTSTYYEMQCGPVQIDLVFTSPMIIRDLDLLSTPVNYISYQVKATDGRQHDVQLYLSATPEIGMDNVGCGIVPAVSTVEEHDGISYAKTGTLEQPILAKKGDGVCIDWGYLYLSGANGTVGIAPYRDMQQYFVRNGKILTQSSRIVSRKASDMVALAYCHDFGQVAAAPQASYAMIGYDEVEDIEYMYHRYKGYWAHQGKVTIYDAFNKMQRGYADIMKQCYAQDKEIYDDGYRAGGQQYAELLCASYRQCIAAHKLFEDNEGKLLFFSKENNSNGSVNTVDLTYPESPLFLSYNPGLQKAMMTSIFDYSLSGRWIKPFAAHDLGTYPKANGQTYGGDMPLEESGNMLTLAATLCELDGRTDWVDPYWDLITKWVGYLADNGQDPANQLCTDDFAGHWAHNCNLSVKAIMGVLGYSRMARMKGLTAEADKYERKACEMAAKWEQDARDGDHYRLAFDKPGTWSQKYNMIWDKIWGTHIFSKGTMEREVKYYLTKQNPYGLPLDIRKDYTKSDWIMWSTAMATSDKDFRKFVTPLWRYVNETSTRVPLSDWYDSQTAKYEHFIARSVVGGHWMKVFVDKFASRKH